MESGGKHNAKEMSRDNRNEVVRRQLRKLRLTGDIEVTHTKGMGRHCRQRNEEEKRLGRHRSRSICSKTRGKSTNF